MKRNVLVLIAVVIGFSLAAIAGTISGQVSGVAGQSVVYVDAIPGKTFPPPTEQPVIDQKGLAFHPHVMAVQAGTTVAFLNSDSVAHNVFWASVGGNKKLGHNLGTWPQGQTKSYTFAKECAAVLLCKVHPEMEAYVVAVPTPYFTSVKADGSFHIGDVPDGSYTVKIWHPKLKAAEKPATVAGATEVDFEIAK